MLSIKHLTTNMHKSRACKVKKHIFHSKVFIHNEGEPMVNRGSECAIACLIWWPYKWTRITSRGPKYPCQTWMDKGLHSGRVPFIEDYKSCKLQHKPTTYLSNLIGVTYITTNCMAFLHKHVAYLYITGCNYAQFRRMAFKHKACHLILSHMI